MQPDAKLKTAVLGLDNDGQFLLEAALRTDYFHIQAVADKDTDLAEKVASKYNCSVYDDYRQLIMQNQFDCLLVAAGMYSCDEHIKTAIKKKFNILKLAPPARTFEEAAEFARLVEEENTKFIIANPSRFSQSFLALRDFLQQNRPEQITGSPNVPKSDYEPTLITVFHAIGNQTYPSWQTDPKLAGGGVLLHNCYDMIDQIVWNFDTPQQIYSLNTNLAGDRQQRLYLTEDAAVVTVKFTDAFFGNIIATRVFGPEQKLLKIYGKNKILTVTDSQFIISDALGQIIEKFEYADDNLRCMVKLLENFALSILAPDKNKPCSSIKENLKNMAVIESAYLSGRTAMPEEPARILKMSHFEPINIWS